MMSHPWYERRFIWLFFLILALQLFGMVLIPFSGTSEPRYAEIARMMAESGDWIRAWRAFLGKAASLFLGTGAINSIVWSG